MVRMVQVAGMGPGHAGAIGHVGKGATFAAKRVRDGSLKATLNENTLPIPSFRAADLPRAALEQVATVRRQIKSFQSDQVGPLVRNAGSSAEALVQDGPTIDSSSTAATAGLLLRAKVLVQSSHMAESSSARAANVLPLIR